MKTKPESKPSVLRRLARWHRSLGLVGALFVLLLALTGVLINHSADFNLEKRYIESLWLLNVYGVEPPTFGESFRVGDHWVSRIEKQIYFDNRQVAFTDEPLLGALQQDRMIVLATSKRLFLFDLQGNLVDQLGREHGMPEGLSRLGSGGDRITLQAADGRYSVDLDNLRWTKAGKQSVRWSETEVLPDVMREQISTLARRRMLSLDQFVRDLHSGRIMGSWGVWLMDVIAFLFLALTITGIWMWWRAKREFGGKEAGRRPKPPKT